MAGSMTEVPVNGGTLPPSTGISVMEPAIGVASSWRGRVAGILARGGRIDHPAQAAARGGRPLSGNAVERVREEVRW